MTSGPDTYRDPSDAAEAAPVLSPGARIATETTLASDEGWKASAIVRDETMPLKTLPNGQKIWYFEFEGKMVYGREASTRENLRDLFKRASAPAMKMVQRHATTNAPIFLCDADGNFILSEED